MLNWHELYPSQSFRVKYGSRKMSGFQVISSILIYDKNERICFCMISIIGFYPPLSRFFKMEETDTITYTDDKP